MPDGKTLILAAHIAPMDRAPIRDGALAVSGGRILEVGDARAVSRAHRDAQIVDLGQSLLLPGLVNAHTHLELSSCRAGPDPGGHFGQWILRISEQLRAQGDDIERVIATAIAEGVRQCRRFGVTTVGDISQQNHLSRPLLTAAEIRCVSFGEALGLARQRPRFEQLLERALQPVEGSDRIRIGLSPHAPYTVDLPGYRQCLEIARQRQLPLATHLAENPEEQDFLEHQRGVFRDIWEALQMWEEPVETFAGRPVEFAHALGLLDYPTLLAHVNYCSDSDLKLLSNRRASVVYCPRTHQYFGHPPHRWREMLRRGINVAVGTDSCASSPDLNLVDELRLLRRLAPDLPAATLWEMATLRAAAAIGMEREVGSLAPGKRADGVVFAATSADPLEQILNEQQLPTAVIFNGQVHTRCSP